MRVLYGCLTNIEFLRLLRSQFRLFIGSCCCLLLPRMLRFLSLSPSGVCGVHRLRHVVPSAPARG